MFTSFSRYPAKTSVSLRRVTLHFPLRRAQRGCQRHKCIFSVSKTRRKNLVWWHPCRIQSPKKGIKKKKVVSSLFCAHFFCCLKSFLTLTRCNIWITRIHSLPVWIKVSGQKSKQRHRGVPKPAKRCDPGVLGPVQGLLSVAHGWNTSGVTVSG